MLNLAPLFKDYHRETGSLNQHINLFGFIDDKTFLTRGGAVGVVVAVEGIDYECLDDTQLENATHRFRAAVKVFDDNFRHYQYLHKREDAEIPHQLYGNPVLDQAISNRASYLKGKKLYSMQLHYVILYEGWKSKGQSDAQLLRLLESPVRVLRDIVSSFSQSQQEVILGAGLTDAAALLANRVNAFTLQLSDLCRLDVLPKNEVFLFLASLLNFDKDRISLRLKYDTFLDTQVCNSLLECHSRHLKLDETFVRVLTMKEPSDYSAPLIWRKLQEIEAPFIVVTEWKQSDSATMIRMINAKRRHYHNSKVSLFSQVLAGASKQQPMPHEIMVDDSKAAMVKELTDAKQAIEMEGHSFGEFSLSVILYGQELSAINQAEAEVIRVFASHDASLFVERYNLFNAYMACIPGGQLFNLRKIYINSVNYADYSFFLTLHEGERRNRQLDAEYLAVLETPHKTPYYLNLHHQDTAHTVVLGKTGSGKSFLMNFLLTFFQKYDPLTFIFDLGGSYRSLTEMFSGQYLSVGQTSRSFQINPFCLEKTKENLNFLSTFIRLLMEDGASSRLTHAQELDLWHTIEALYDLAPKNRRLSVLYKTLAAGLRPGLERWIEHGQFSGVFDNVEDTLTFSQFQTVEFEGMGTVPQLVEPLLFYLLHRANQLIQQDTRLKVFVIDEAWMFFRNPTVRSYIVEALKTWRKRNAIMILVTQSVDELKRSEMLQLVQEGCSTKIFLANPDFDASIYSEIFHLNEREAKLITELIPKRQMLVKKPSISKVLNLNVDPKSYWLYTSDPMDNKLKNAAVAELGLDAALDKLSQTKGKGQ